VIRSVFALAAVIVGCSSDPETAARDQAAYETPGPRMRPGDNCLRCHNDKSTTGAPPWTAAGTVYARPDAERTEGLAGVKVVLKDAKGKTVTLITNEVGNFWTAEPLEAPFVPTLERDGRTIAMPYAPPAGSCNACHSIPSVGANPATGARTPGRIFAP
jgi:hypothetical protein